MIDIWNALSMEHKICIVTLIVLIPLAIYHHIDSYGGWTLYLARKRRGKRRGKK